MHIGICEYCGKKSQYKYKSVIKRYCSHSCANNASANVRMKDKATLVCEYCNKKFRL